MAHPERIGYFQQTPQRWPTLQRKFQQLRESGLQYGPAFRRAGMGYGGDPEGPPVGRKYIMRGRRQEGSGGWGGEAGNGATAHILPTKGSSRVTASQSRRLLRNVHVPDMSEVAPSS